MEIEQSGFSAGANSSADQCGPQIFSTSACHTKTNNTALIRQCARLNGQPNGKLSVNIRKNSVVCRSVNGVENCLVVGVQPSVVLCIFTAPIGRLLVVKLD